MDYAQSFNDSVWIHIFFDSNYFLINQADCGFIKKNVRDFISFIAPVLMLGKTSFCSLFSLFSYVWHSLILGYIVKCFHWLAWYDLNWKYLFPLICKTSQLVWPSGRESGLCLLSTPSTPRTLHRGGVSVQGGMLCQSLTSRSIDTADSVIQPQSAHWIL